MTTVTLRNDTGQETTLEVDTPGALEAARTAKDRQVTTTGDRSWRVLRSVGLKGA